VKRGERGQYRQPERVTGRRPEQAGADDPGQVQPGSQDDRQSEYPVMAVDEALDPLRPPRVRSVALPDRRGR
jgi:hypothetical protein